MRAFYRHRYLLVLIVVMIFFSSCAYAQSENFIALNFSDAIKKVLPCVVRVLGEASPEKIQEYMAESAVSDDKKIYSIGSGFFISADGKIVTANHVVAPIIGEIIIEARYTGSISKYKANILLQDDKADMAIIKIDEKNCPSVDMVDPIKLELGEEIGFIGFPLLSSFPMVNKGIIAAKVNMPLMKGLDSRNLLILNAFVNQGNSGGPIFLERTGQVIGIVNARKTADVKERMIKLPENYTPIVTLGGVDPIRLSVETYNANLELIGDVSQFGIGYAVSVEYILKQIESN